MIHRDLKPGNIMVDASGEPVVLDFGLARDLEGDGVSITKSGDFLGTPAYMSPEQIASGHIHLDRRSDVYSLGVTLYECLTLKRPFDAPTREGLYQAILSKEPPDPRRLNKAISADLKVVLETALNKDRDRRYVSAEAFADDLKRVRELKPIQAKPISPIGRLVRWGRRNPLVAAMTAAVFLSLAIGLVATLMQWGRAEKALVRAEESANIATAKTLDWERLADGRLLDRPDDRCRYVPLARGSREDPGDGGLAEEGGRARGSSSGAPRRARSGARARAAVRRGGQEARSRIVRSGDGEARRDRPRDREPQEDRRRARGRGGRSDG